jgi:NAD(P)-dependent dehydrogenase (short-subunit alcohol dehydrogenase family)
VDLGLAGRRALVTGGTKGIGRAIAEGLVAEGARVVVVSRSGDAVPGCELAIAADLAARGAPERAVAEAVAALGGLDVLVNNVGVARQVSFDDLDDDDWQAALDLNVMSYVRAIRGALPHLRASDQARIVNVSSTAGKRPSTGMPDYTVTKAAVLSLSRLVADLEAKNGVLCNALCPGPSLTPAWLEPGGLADQAVARGGGDRDAVLARVAAGRPLNRMAEPDEIARVAVFLCSAAASYVTGAAWGVDGGTVPVII